MRWLSEQWNSAGFWQNVLAGGFLLVVVWLLSRVIGRFVFGSDPSISIEPDNAAYPWLHIDVTNTGLRGSGSLPFVSDTKAAAGSIAFAVFENNPAHTYEFPWNVGTHPTPPPPKSADLHKGHPASVKFYLCPMLKAMDYWGHRLEAGVGYVTAMEWQISDPKERSVPGGMGTPGRYKFKFTVRSSDGGSWSRRMSLVIPTDSIIQPHIEA